MTQDLAAKFAEEGAKLLQAIPEWSDTERAARELAELRRYAVDKGLYDFHTANGPILDHAVVVNVKAHRDAYLREQEQQRRIEEARDNAMLQQEVDRKVRLQQDEERRQAAEDAEQRRHERLEQSKRTAAGLVHNNFGSRAEALADFLESGPDGQSEAEREAQRHERAMFERQGIKWS